jgi:hypothetical protein
MRFFITYKVRFTNAEGSIKVLTHHTYVTANNAVDGLFRAFEGCPQHTRDSIFDITIIENKGE